MTVRDLSNWLKDKHPDREVKLIHFGPYECIPLTPEYLALELPPNTQGDLFLNETHGEEPNG